MPVALLVQDEPRPSDPGGDVTHGRGFGMSPAREELGEKQERQGQMRGCPRAQCQPCRTSLMA